MKLAKKIAVVLVLVAGLGAALVYGAPRLAYSAAKKTFDAPSEWGTALCDKSGDDLKMGPVTVVIGDDLVRGVFGRDFTIDARDNLPPYHTLINAGRNGDDSEALIGRVDEILGCKPDKVAILVGARDAVKALEDGRESRALLAYYKNLTVLADRLTADKNRRVAIFSLPVGGDAKEGPFNALLGRFSQMARLVAAEHDMPFLELRARHEEILARTGAETPATCKRPEDVEASAKRAIWLYYSRSEQSWDAIARQSGRSLTVDCIHMSETGGESASQLLVDFVLAPDPPPASMAVTPDDGEGASDRPLEEAEESGEP